MGMKLLIILLFVSATTLCGQSQKFDFVIRADVFSIPTSSFTSDIQNPKYEVSSNSRVNEAGSLNVTW